ncbi:2-amino-4-hydroxy-6-hydroxymethyldihydropteridine diphosphokinase [Pararhodospirillum photometricum]|nr:2-amino-4-hydroxy-6-hydroxymethyldihydropteridine diphosphokinase [Pararhodospirillum photometricum]
MILIALGSNLPSPAGPPRETLVQALAALDEAGVRVEICSEFYLTAPVPPSGQPDYVNAVARVATDRPPEALLTLLHAIEARFDRERTALNAARTLDLDLLDYHGRCQEGPPCLPHPRLAERAFVLVPLADIAPTWIHPHLQRDVHQLLAALPPGQDIRPA